MRSSEQRPSSRLRLLARTLSTRADVGGAIHPAETLELARFLEELAGKMDADDRAAAPPAAASGAVEAEIAKLRELAVRSARYGVPRREG